MTGKCQTIINIKAAKNKELGVLGIAIWETQSETNKKFSQKRKESGAYKSKDFYTGLLNSCKNYDWL